MSAVLGTHANILMKDKSKNKWKKPIKMEMEVLRYRMNTKEYRLQINGNIMTSSRALDADFYGLGKSRNSKMIFYGIGRVRE